MRKLGEEDFQNLLKNNEMIKLASEELEKIFKNKFCLTEEEIKSTILDIVSNFDEEVVLKLTDVFQKFVENDIENFDRKKRNSFAKRTIKYCIDLYYENSNFIIQDFFEVLEQAKKLKIDPFKIAIKGNLINATKESFNKSLVALVESEYEDLITGNMFRLFDLDEIKEVLEQCSSLICGINEKRIQKVLYLLSDFIYDEETDEYIISPRDIIRKCYMILKESPKNLERNIDYLLDTFVPDRMSKRELVLRIYQSPSILLCSPKKIKEFEGVLAENIYKIINDEGFSLYKLNDEQKLEFATSEAEKYCNNLDNFNTINGINKKGIRNIENIREILIKNLGANNALKCINKPFILDTDANVLDCFLLRLAKEEFNNKDFRTFFIENTRKCMDYIKREKGAGVSVIGKSSSDKRDKTIADKEAIPTDEDAEKTYQEKLAKLSEVQKRELQKIMDNFYVRFNKKDKEGEDALSEEEAFQLAKSKDKDELIIPYLNILDKVETYLDTMYGDGYCKSFHIEDYVNSYKDNIFCEHKFHLMSKELDEKIRNSSLLSAVYVDVGSNLPNYKKIYQTLLESMKTLNKYISESKDINERTYALSDDLAEMQRNVVELFDKAGYFKHESSSFATEALFNETNYLQYVMFMYDKLKQSYPNRYKDIISESVIQEMLDESPFVDKLIVCSFVNTISQNIENIMSARNLYYIGLLKEAGLPIDEDSIKDGSKLKIYTENPYLNEGDREKLVEILTNINSINYFREKVLYSGKAKAQTDKFRSNVDLQGWLSNGLWIFGSPDSDIGYTIDATDEDIKNAIKNIDCFIGKDMTIIDLTYGGLLNYLGIVNEDFKVNINKRDKEKSSSKNSPKVDSQNNDSNNINEHQSKDDENDDSENQ